MDYKKWNYEFKTKFKSKIVETVDSIRKGIEILDTQNWPEFSERIKHWKVSSQELTNLIKANLPLESWEENFELFPALLIDFDDKRLFSVFTEPTKFENYVPSNWNGKLEDFFSLIPMQEKYWIINSIDYMPNE